MGSADPKILRFYIFTLILKKSENSEMRGSLYIMHGIKWGTVQQNHLKQEFFMLTCLYNHRSLKLGPYISYIASKPKAHSVITK